MTSLIFIVKYLPCETLVSIDRDMVWNIYAITIADAIDEYCT